MGAFDTTTKFLVERHASDWLRLAGLSVGGRSVRVMDADLSTVASVPDKIMWVKLGRRRFAVHLELQSSDDRHLDARILAYNVLARRRLGLPVRSVAFLLRPLAGPPSVRGRVDWAEADSSPLSFAYQLVRVWQLPVADLLAGGLGTLPLAPIAAVDRADVPGVIRRVRDRLDRETPPATSAALLHATRLLVGLRYDRAEVKALFRGVQHMRESSYYQEILDEGRVEGRVEGERDLLLRQATAKFGRPPAGTLGRVRAITDLRELERLGVALLAATGWADWLAGRPAAAPVKRRRRSVS